jgi:hypothetical protein
VALNHGWGAVDRKRDPECETGAFIGELVSIELGLTSINYMPRQSAIPVSVQPYLEQAVA